MDYRYLKAFILTAEYSSFSKAANQLKIAQSAVSRQIKLLEESLEEELIIRSSKKVLLTNKGKELYLAAQQFDQLASDIFQREDSRPINVGILHGLLKNWFVPRIIKFYKKSNRSIKLHVDLPQNLKTGIENGKFDIIFSIENIQSDLITSLKLFDEKLVLISKSPVNRKALHEYRWVVYSEEDNIFKISKTQSNSIIMIDSITSIVELVKNNVGIAVVPDHVLKKTDSLVVQELPNLGKSEIFMTTLNYKTMPAPIAEISQLVQK